MFQAFISNIQYTGKRKKSLFVLRYSTVLVEELYLCTMTKKAIMTLSVIISMKFNQNLTHKLEMISCAVNAPKSVIILLKGIILHTMEKPVHDDQ